MKFFNQKQLAVALLGLLAVPFLYFSFPRLPAGSEQSMFSPELALHGYSVLVASFFAGIQWGVHFCKRTEDSVYLLSFSTIVLAWLSLLMPGSAAGLSVMLVVFLLSWIEEWRLSRQRVTTAWFWQVRCVSTGVICLSLLLSVSHLLSR